jgi:nitronate monooxygenase
MADVSTPEMAATVSNAGGIGSFGVGAVDADATQPMIAAVRSGTGRPLAISWIPFRILLSYQQPVSV